MNKQTLQYNNSKLINIFRLTLVILTFAFYYNSIYNHFSMDDYHVNTDNPIIAKGVAGIPEIFTTLYAEESGMAYGYRPLVRTSFALEYQFTRNLEINPYISHAINVLLYIISILLLYKVLQRLFTGYNVWFPFLITVLFMAHPTHTEVVASLKNRDILLNFIFSTIAIWNFVLWSDHNKPSNLIMGFVSFILAFLSKESAIAQLAVFPLVLYFFTEIKIKKLTVFTFSLAVIIGMVFIATRLLLPEFDRGLKMWENPLIVNTNVFVHLGTAIYIIGHYLKMLIIPWPLLYYYGYNMIPLVGFGNVWVILTSVVLIVLLYFGFEGIKKKKLLSFIILYFFVNISMYANIVAPVPGIVGDRFMFFTSLSFAMAIVLLLFTVFKIDYKANTKNKKTIWVAILILIIIIPYGYYVKIRNSHWKTHFSLYSADMSRLENSVKANALYAHELMKRANAELSKPVNTYKFILGTITKAEKHYNKVIELDSTHSSTYNNLGIINSKIHGNQAKLRMQSYLSRNNDEKALIEEKNAIKYFNKARDYFKKAIFYNPDFGSAYFNLANSYELQNKYDSAVIFFQKAVEADGGEIVSMSRLANANFRTGNIKEAIEINENIISKYPDSDMPYINLANYAISNNDTANAIMFYDKAVKLGTKPEVGNLLSGYYKSKGDINKANYYARKAYESEQLQRKKLKNNAK